jgi:Ca2+-binding EF-hand superfamily protein
LKEK